MTGYLSRVEAAEYLGRRIGRRVSPRTLGQWASDAKGPRYVLLLGQAAYTATDLDDWLAAEATRPNRKGRPRKVRDHERA